MCSRDAVTHFLKKIIFKSNNRTVYLNDLETDWSTLTLSFPGAAAAVSASSGWPCSSASPSPPSSSAPGTSSPRWWPADTSGKRTKIIRKNVAICVFFKFFPREDYLQTWWTLAGMAAMMAGQVEMIIKFIINISSKMDRKCQSCFPSHHRLSLGSSPRSSWEGSSSSCTSLTSRHNIWYNHK